MVKRFPRIARKLGKRIFKFFRPFFCTIFELFPRITIVLKTMTISVSPVGNFQEITAVFCYNWPQKLPKIHETTKKYFV